MAKKMNEEPKVRTRTRVRQGGAVVKTKTVTKGGGMKRVERTKTRDNALGSFSSRSVSERGPKGKIGMTEFKGVTPFGEAYGYKAEKMKMGGRKTVASKYYDVEGTDVLSKQKGKGYKTKTVKITDADGRTIVKSKGMKSPKPKATLQRFVTTIDMGTGKKTTKKVGKPKKMKGKSISEYEFNK